MVRNESVAERLIDRFEPQLVWLIRGVRRMETYLGPDDDWIEDDRRALYEWADTFLRPIGRAAIRKKGPADYITTVDVSPDAVEEALDAAGYQRNLLSTRKYREHHDGGRQWAVGAYVVDDGDRQHHVYIFPSWSGGTDVYGHEEPSVQQPLGHVTKGQIHGDPNGSVVDALDAAELTHEPQKSISQT